MAAAASASSASTIAQSPPRAVMVGQFLDRRVPRRCWELMVAAPLLRGLVNAVTSAANRCRRGDPRTAAVPRRPLGGGMRPAATHTANVNLRCATYIYGGRRFWSRIVGDAPGGRPS